MLPWGLGFTFIVNGRTLNFGALHISSILESVIFLGPVVEEESLGFLP